MAHGALQGTSPLPLLVATFLFPSISCDLQPADKITDSGPDHAALGDSSFSTADTWADSGDFQQPEEDADADGYTEAEGDCDDSNPDVHPDTLDDCNGEDDDCDGTIDEDAAGRDSYEPNDESWAYLGSLEDTDEFNITAWLHNDEDLDLFSFYVEDHWWDSFGVTIRLFDIPEGAIYQLSVGKIIDDVYTESDSLFGDDSMEILLEGTAITDDSGTYGVVISSLGGADCGSFYLLSVSSG